MLASAPTSHAMPYHSDMSAPAVRVAVATNTCTGACMAATTGAAAALIGAGSNTATISNGTSAHSA